MFTTGGDLRAIDLEKIQSFEGAATVHLLSHDLESFSHRTMSRLNDKSAQRDFFDNLSVLARARAFRFVSVNTELH
eukprot:CAMPEP_0178373292 /NCGR_PEP_ID=MMETSP0689_2-20121128/1788_1 /TAXON_ID=160604 /ORGANISM="Amphidinium massartii, Strain CS-259" /LENGTH=75 /DNA_ID=CAMNT_0019993231 /DNA_START=296 /DNA_END=523 /DNA_ORIENTATION=-